MESLCPQRWLEADTLMSPHTEQKPPPTAELMPATLSYLLQENPLMHHHLTARLRGEAGQIWTILPQIKEAKWNKQIYELRFIDK